MDFIFKTNFCNEIDGFITNLLIIITKLLIIITINYYKYITIHNYILIYCNDYSR